eukprot:8478251-Heterocapsa_arctica.AAC.1
MTSERGVVIFWLRLLLLFASALLPPQTSRAFVLVPVSQSRRSMTPFYFSGCLPAARQWEPGDNIYLMQFFRDLPGTGSRAGGSGGAFF